MTNICSEIVLHTDESHSFCLFALSSVNLNKYDEWKNTNLILRRNMVLRRCARRIYPKSKKYEGL